MRKTALKKSVKRKRNTKIVVKRAIIQANPKRRTRKNPNYKVSAKVASGIRPITYDVKVPTRTLAVLATRGYVQEMGGGNPNAYTYKSTKLGLGKWRIEAIPKVKASSATVKALTAGSAVRKFKKTLAGRGRFKTPRGAYEISVERNPKRKRNPKGKPPDWAQASEGFQGQRKSIEADALDVILRRSGGSGYTRIYFNDVFDDLREEGHSVADIKQALLNLSRAGKVVLMSFDDPNEERKLKQRYSISSGGRDNQFLRYRNPARRKSAKAKKSAVKTRKRRNGPKEDYVLAGRIGKQIELLKKKPETAAREAQIKKLQAYLAKIFERAETARQKEVSEMWAAPRSFSTKKRVGGGVRKKKANPHYSQLDLQRVNRKILKFEKFLKNDFAELKRAQDRGEMDQVREVRQTIKATQVDLKNAKIQARQAQLSLGQQKLRARNSIKGSIKKVVKSVKKIFRNDGHSNREKFAGKLSGDKDLFFPPGTPPADELSTLGPLESFTTTGRGKITFQKGQAVLCQDADDNLYVGMTKPSAAFYSNGGPLRNADLGKIKQVEYDCAKPHLGAKYKKNTPWFHDFKSPLPHLKTDEEGRPIIKGGGYRIEPEGITG